VRAGKTQLGKQSLVVAPKSLVKMGVATAVEQCAVALPSPGLSQRLSGKKLSSTSGEQPATSWVNNETLAAAFVSSIM